MSQFPSVTAVVPTRNRPELLGRAIRSILSQDYDGDLDILIVVDQDDPATATAGLPDDPRIHVMSNERAQGLSGTRNTGILACKSDLVAFCDDDDEWLPEKLTKQVASFDRMPEAEMSTCAVEVDYAGTRSTRLAGSNVVDHNDLLRSRMFMLHSSTFLFRREALIDGIGLIAEDAPGSQNEDWDVLLRASARRPIVHVDEALACIYWSGSYFSRDWATKISSLEWMLAQHPDIKTSTVGAARVYGQIAFGYAASGQRKTALKWARQTIRTRPTEPRAYLALATTAGVSGEWILSVLHKRGRGV